jgi:hypothetical protein
MGVDTTAREWRHLPGYSAVWSVSEQAFRRHITYNFRVKTQSNKKAACSGCLGTYIAEDGNIHNYHCEECRLLGRYAVWLL